MNKLLTQLARMIVLGLYVVFLLVIVAPLVLLAWFVVDVLFAPFKQRIKAVPCSWCGREFSECSLKESLCDTCHYYLN